MKEALKLALEALKKTQSEGYNLPSMAISEAILVAEAALAQPEPVKITHKHEWFRTGEMKVGQMRCISCGTWGQEDRPQQPKNQKQRPFTKKQRDTLCTVYAIASASTTANSLPNIAKIVNELLTEDLEVQPKEPEQEPVALCIDGKNINNLQAQSIQRVIARSKGAHMTDIKLRINGQDEWYEADWIKYLKQTTEFKCDGDFPEGFDSSCGLPAQALRTANAIMCDTIGKREWDVPCAAQHLLSFAKLYTTPPQQEPLTSEQIMEIGQELGLKCRLGGNSNIDFDYARAIEAAHGIKENT